VIPDFRPFVVPVRLLPEVVGLVQRGVRVRQSTDGLGPSPALLEWLEQALHAAREAAMSGGGPAARSVGGSAAGFTEHTVAEAAELLGVRERHVRRLVSRGEIRGRKVAGGAWMIERRSVDDYGHSRQEGRGGEGA
jgi:excisionase family DNA binding protein